MLKFGKGGDFPLPEGDEFDQGHAVHVNNLEIAGAITGRNLYR